jgi:hypothetical protein
MRADLAAHRHALMTMHRLHVPATLASKKRCEKKKIDGTATSTFRHIIVLIFRRASLALPK